VIQDSMASFPDSPLAPPASAPIGTAQPGGGWVMGLEERWGACRRWMIRAFFKDHLARFNARRLGNEDPKQPDGRIIDQRDLKFLRPVSGVSFEGPDPWGWRGRLGLARLGLGEVVVFSLLLTPCWVAHAVLGVTVHWAWWIGFAPFFIWHLFTIAFFRDPERLVPTGGNLIVSPADGVVTGTEEVDMPDFPGGRALRVSIFLSVFSVHINRAPFAMKTAVVRYYPGLFLDARHADCAERNEQLWVDGFAAKNGLPIRLKQISGAIARRIVCWTKPGDGLNAGERFGLIKFGSRTDLLLPVGSATLRIIKGEGVWGGKTVLGEWKA